MAAPKQSPFVQSVPKPNVQQMPNSNVERVPKLSISSTMNSAGSASVQDQNAYRAESWYKGRSRISAKG